MSDRTTADTIAEAFAEARPVFGDAFLADRYELLADVEVEDEYGGRTMVEQVVESETVGNAFPLRGRCKLDVAARQGTEGGTVVRGIGPYIADLPVETIATANHRIRINGREFAITSPPKQAGHISIFTRLELEAKSTA